MKNGVATIIVLIGSSLMIFAQPGGQGAGNPGGGSSPSRGLGVPIDGVASIFVLSVVGYAFKKVKEKEGNIFKL